jgi:hypothetical protein
MNLMHWTAPPQVRHGRDGERIMLTYPSGVAPRLAERAGYLTYQTTGTTSCVAAPRVESPRW